MKHALIARVFALSALAFAALCAAPAAEAAPHSACSLSSLKGTYSSRDAGYLTAPPAFAGPFAGVSLETFDGNGVLIGSGMTSINGNTGPNSFQGTYTVNPDCT